MFLGGTLFVMGAVLDEHDTRQPPRMIWAADSFDGVPHPSRSDRVGPHRGCRLRERRLDLSAAELYSDLTIKATCNIGGRGEFNATWATVQRNLVRAAVSTHRIRWLPGWFADTLPAHGMRRLSFLHVDGDLYNSTKQVLVVVAPLRT